MRAGKVVVLILASIAVSTSAIVYWHLRSEHPVSSPVWVIDPHAHASDLPQAGRSLFDMTVIDRHDGQSRYDVPYPFSALLARIQEQAHSKTSIFKPVLIPAGRSLQRSAAAPEFFRFPRIVVAVDTDSGTSGAPLLKDRLYLGYQEKAAVIEVISYNDVEGRFEFQIVKNYRAGATPQVVYANRAICTACHQNAAPIFSLPLWDETQANPLIAAGLKATHRDFYGLTLNAASDVVYAVDNATDRANRYSLYQNLWAACSDVSTTQELRRSVFVEVLRYGLSTQAVIAAAVPDFQTAARLCAETWQRRWPQGLALPNPNIPNRNPFLQRVGNGVTHPLAALEPRGALSDRKIEAEIGAAFEPLTPRRPLDIWQPGADKFQELVRGLSEFLARSDWRLIDRALRDNSRTLTTPTRTVSARCARVVESVSAERWTCRDAGLDLVLYLDRHTPSNSMLSLLRVGDNAALSNLTLDSVTPVASGATLGLAGRDGMAFRLPTAERVTRIAIVNRVAYVDLLEDFGLIVTAVHGSKVPEPFVVPVFRRAQLLPALYRKLGIDDGGACCTAVPVAPLPRGGDTQDDATTTLAVNADQALFRDYCARCHATDERVPPNFLRGDSATVEQNLNRCAERIYFRLSMWPLPQSARPKTPMPPSYALAAHGLDEPQWQHHRDLERLRNAVRARLMREPGRTQTPDALLHEDYAHLRACLAENISIH